MLTLKKSLSMILVVMLIATVFGILLSVKVSAADGGACEVQISSPSDGGTINGYDTVKIKWNKYSGADHYWITIKDEKTGVTAVNEEYSGNTYRVYSDDGVFTEKGRRYKIYVAAMDANGKVLGCGDHSECQWNAIYVTNELELETPEITSHEKLDTHCVDDPLYVNWDAVDGANGYTVSVKKLNGAPDYDNDNEAGTNIAYTWSDDCAIKIAASKLVADKWYKIALCAKNTDQDVYSDWTSIYVLMEESAYLNLSDCDDIAAEKNSTGSFWIYSNVDWTISCNVSWLTWTIDQMDDTHAEVILKATSANTGTSDRKAKITVSGDGVDDEIIYVYQLAPEIELPSFGNVSVSKEITIGEDITWSANIDGNGSLLKTVTVGIYSKTLNDSIYFRTTNINAQRYSLSGSVHTGGIVSGYDASGNAKTLDLSIAGEYTVTFHAATDAAVNNYVSTAPVTITLSEPVGTGILGDVNSDGKVSNIDRFILNRYLANMIGYLINRENSDIDGDNNVSEYDLEILDKYLAKHPGYDNLEKFKSPTLADDTVWNLDIVSGGSRLNVNLASGAIDSNKKYLFIAEDKNGGHYVGYIAAGSTSASFNIKDMYLPRGQEYDFYVVPDGVYLASNKKKYYITTQSIPLYAGDMIISVKSGDIVVYDGGNIYIDEDLIISWDGSYGVFDSTVSVTANGRTIYNKAQNSDGPGTITISADTIESAGNGNISISVTVVPDSESGLSNAVSTWDGTIVDRSVESSNNNTDITDELVDEYLDYHSAFEQRRNPATVDIKDFIYNHQNLLGLSMTIDIVSNLDDLFVYKEFSDYAGTHALVKILDEMDEQYYLENTEDTIDVVASLMDYICTLDDSELAVWLNNIKSMCEKAENIAIAHKVEAMTESIRLDNINNELSQYIEFLFDLAIDEDAVQKEYARILKIQKKNISTKQALAKVEKASATFAKGFKFVTDAMGKISLIAKISEAIYYTGVEDFSTDLLKLNVLITALEEHGDPDLLDAAKLLQLEMTSDLYQLAKAMVELGTDTLYGWLDDYTSSIGTAIKNGVDATVCVAYVYDIDRALYQSIISMYEEYTSNADKMLLHEIKKELHAMADCRALLNSLAVDLYKIYPHIPHMSEKALLGYKTYYKGCHDDIELLFD